MDAILQLQNDLTDKLDSESYFNYVAVFSYRRTVIKNEINKLSPHTVGKNGKVGVGVMVGLPSIKSLTPNVSTPEGMIYLPVDVIGNDEMSFFLDNGAKLTAEEVARAVRAYGHHFQIEEIGILYQDTNAIEPLAGLEKDFPGCNGYRVNFAMRLAEKTIMKVPTPSIDFVVQNQEYGSGSVTLSSSVGGVTIYFTTDGSFPGPANAAATVYANPFDGTVGDVIRFAAFADGYQGSNSGLAKLTA